MSGLGRAVSLIVLVCVFLFAIAGVSMAAATGECPPAFEGPYTIEQAKALPRTVAGLEAGAYDVAYVEGVFNSVDGNEDGLVCFQDHKNAEKTSDSAGWAYLYNLVDDHAAGR